MLHPRGSSLLKEIYSWQTREEVFGSIGDDNLRTSLKALLVDVFSETVQPSERTCAKLSDFLTAASAAINSAQTEWMPSAESDDDQDREDTATLIDPFRALFQHLQWIYDIFKDRPGTSLLVR